MHLLSPLKTYGKLTRKLKFSTGPSQVWTSVFRLNESIICFLELRFKKNQFCQVCVCVDFVCVCVFFFCVVSKTKMLNLRNHRIWGLFYTFEILIILKMSLLCRVNSIALGGALLIKKQRCRPGQIRKRFEGPGL